MIDNLNLTAEWLGTASLNSRQRRQLEDLGVTREATQRPGDLGWSRVSTMGGRLYTPSDAGEVRVVMPVWVGPAPSIFQAVEHPVLGDLIAWHPDRPTRCWYRVGGPGAVLGADNLDLAHAEGLPISFVLTPLDWLRDDVFALLERYTRLTPTEVQAVGADVFPPVPLHAVPAP